MVLDLGPKANHDFEESRYLLASISSQELHALLVGCIAEPEILSPLLDLSLDQSSLLKQSLHVAWCKQEAWLPSEHNALERDEHLIGKTRH